MVAKKSPHFSKAVAFALLRFLFLLLHRAYIGHKAMQAAKLSYLQQLRSEQQQTATAGGTCPSGPAQAAASVNSSIRLRRLRFLQAHTDQDRLNLGRI